MAFSWVDTTSGLADALDVWRAAGRVGMDSEFVRVSTFFPLPGLYQVATEAGCSLVDPLAVADWKGFAEWLADRATLKVMHACSEDVELLAHHVGVRPSAVFDTQLAAALLGPEMAIGYRALVERELGAVVSKSETRSDWRRRPLSEKQLRYAAADVAHLLPLHDRLSARLHAAGRHHWHDEEAGRVVAGAGPTAAENLYRGIAGAGRLDVRGLAVLRAVCVYREEKARALDKPRNHILPEALLLSVAEAVPVTLAAVEHVLSAFSHHAPGVLAAVSTAVSLAAEALPQPLPEALSPGERERLDRLRTMSESVARQLNVAPGFLASRRALEALVLWQRDRSQPVPAHFAGWRADVFASHLAAA